MILTLIGYVLIAAISTILFVEYVIDAEVLPDNKIIKIIYKCNIFRSTINNHSYPVIKENQWRAIVKISMPICMLINYKINRLKKLQGSSLVAMGRGWRMGRGKIVIGVAIRGRGSLCRCWIMLGRACITAEIYPSIRHYRKAIKRGRKMRRSIIIKIYCIVSILPLFDLCLLCLSFFKNNYCLIAK